MTEKIEFSSFIGVDISKYKIDLYISKTGEYKTICNKDLNEELLKLSDELKSIDLLEKTLVVIDLTGGYEVLSRDIFYSNGFKNILLAEGLKVKSFTRVKRNNKAKTDKIDAKILAEYGELFYKNPSENGIKFYSPKDENRFLLEKYISRIIDLKELKQKELNRLKAPNVPFEILKAIERSIKFLEEELKILKDKINQILNNKDNKDNKELNVIYNFLLNQKGIGLETAHLFISLLPELGKINRRQIASITGTAPTPKDSGTINGYRFTNSGRPIIKKALFLIALSKIRYDETLKNRYQEMQLKGKKKMVAIVAIMRKFIVELNAKLKDELLINDLAGESTHKNQPIK